MPRRGIALLQFGGPDSPEAIRPFLRDLFNDPEILPYPAFVRRPLAWTIAKFRAPIVAENYAKMGGASPIGMWTEKQADALRAALPGVTVEVTMRSWRPSTADAVGRLLAAGCDEILALPLYPQYSFTTSRSSMTELLAQLRRQSKGRGVTLRTIRNWPTHPGYIEATCETVRRGLAEFAEPPFVLFNAHGLPMKVVNKGDPYPQEVRATVDACVKSLGLADGRWALSFQSRVGYLEWLRPYTEEKIPELGASGVKNLLVVPMSFVCDHYETLYEMRMLQGDLAKAAGIERYVVAPSLNAEPRFLAALVELARGGFETAPAEKV